MAELLFMLSSVSLCVLHLMNECFLFYFTFKISLAAFSQCMRPHAHSNVTAADIEDFSRTAVYGRHEKC